MENHVQLCLDVGSAPAAAATASVDVVATAAAASGRDGPYHGPEVTLMAVVVLSKIGAVAAFAFE